MCDYYYLIAGILIGWLTKIPLFIKYYKQIEKEQLEMLLLSKRVLDLMKSKDM